MSFLTGRVSVRTVNSGDIADDAVTLAKMAAGTDGNIISFDTSGDPVAVATGSAGDVLIGGGAGVAPTFTSFTTVDRSWTGSQRATFVADNDGSFDLAVGNDFKCTTAGGAGIYQ